MSAYKTIETTNLATIETIRRPADSHKHLDMCSSAMEIFTDFNLQQPLMLESTVSIKYAEELMKKAHVHLKLVIDKDEHFRGVISLADLLSIKVTKAMDTTGLKREELTVADVMTHKDALQAVEFEKFSHAKIGDLVATMQRFGEQHLLVVETGENSIRGIVSSSDIARRLHVSVYISERANTFSDIYKAVHA